MIASPSPRRTRNDDQGYILGERFESWAEASVRTFSDKDRDVRLAGVSSAVERPVVEDTEAVGVDLTKLDLDAVIRVAVGGQDVEASAMRTCQLLREDADLAQADPGRIVGKPVLKPNLVVAQFAEARGPASVNRGALYGHSQGKDPIGTGSGSPEVLALAGIAWIRWTNIALPQSLIGTRPVSEVGAVCWSFRRCPRTPSASTASRGRLHEPSLGRSNPRHGGV
jgi:hypothetical protein